MIRTVRNILVVSSLAVFMTTGRSMAQQGQIIMDTNGVQEHIVVNSNGTFRVNDDGSFEQIEPTLQRRSVPNMPPSGGRSTPIQGKGTGGYDQPLQQMQQRMRQTSEDSLRKALACSDQEWAVLLPKIQKIEALQSAVMPGSKLRAPAGDVAMSDSIVQLGARVQDFQKLVTMDNASETQLFQCLTSVREARNKVKVDLVKARKELTDVVTQRQEAILFFRGILAD